MMKLTLFVTNNLNKLYISTYTQKLKPTSILHEVTLMQLFYNANLALNCTTI